MLPGAKRPAWRSTASAVFWKLTHFGIIGPPVPGHINPFVALAHELQTRGHRVTFFQIPDLEAEICSEEIGFCPIGAQEHPVGSLRESLLELSKRPGLAALRFTVRAIQKTTETICRDAPAAVKGAHVDVLLVDQTEPAGGTVAEYLGLPFVTICNALALNREPGVPPPFTPWRYRDDWWGRTRNQLGNRISDRILAPVRETLAERRAQWNLPAHTDLDKTFSRLAQISQQPPEFDFPRRSLPDVFHYAGPLRHPRRRQVEFQWEWLDGRPLIYASLGTLQNKNPKLFHCFAEACRGLDVQLVIAGAGKESLGSLPENVLAVSYAPQLELLAKASLTLSHGGLNTVLDSLACGVPLVVMPITYEQPAISQRVRWVGAGEMIPVSRVNSSLVRTRIKEVLGNPAYAGAAKRIAEGIRTAGGVKRAGDLIEKIGRGETE
uniref:Glycosyl transferase n=1 Tax=uncultured bacterium CSLG7 TaxID=1091577 RepID=G4WV45_9BACT|nr:glycosyl transferase [uncultured bacterium CSLG7]